MRFLKTRLPDPQVVQKYLLNYAARELYLNPGQFPIICSASLFANERPLALEVGCGCGEYLCSLAKNNPTTNFVGIDKSPKSLYQGVFIAEAYGLQNVKFIEVDMHLLYPLLVPSALQTVYLHFPEPYYKPQIRARRRIFSPRFLDAMYQALQPGGLLSVVSDHEEFFMEMLELAEHDGRFAKAHAERYIEGFDPGVKSRFQMTWEGYGVVPRRFTLRKETVGETTSLTGAKIGEIV
jgi:tRNA (guanine-N7-)-methyltransferase